MSLDQTIRFRQKCLESFKDGDISITLTMRTPKAKPKCKQNVWQRQHNKFSQYCRFVQTRCLDYLFRVYEFTHKGYLHVHAIAKANAQTETKLAIQLLNMYAEEYGFYQRDIYYIKKYDSWMTYMLKDIDNTLLLLKEHKIKCGVSSIYQQPPLVLENEERGPCVLPSPSDLDNAMAPPN